MCLNVLRLQGDFAGLKVNGKLNRLELVAWLGLKGCAKWIGLKL